MTGKCICWTVGVLVALVLAAGCQTNEPPTTKQARLIAAQNMELNEQLSRRDTEIAELKAQHAQEIQQRDNELAAGRARIEALRADLATRVDSVMASVMAENARLRREIDELKARLKNDAP